MKKIMKICKKHGELTADDVYDTSKRCRLCNLERCRRYKSTRRKELCEKNKIYKSKNRHIVNSWAAQDRKNNPEKYREWSRKHAKKVGAEGITRAILRQKKLKREIYDQMIKDQKNLCAICGKAESRTIRSSGKVMHLCIDHCHKTNKVRGLVCAMCNLGIHYFKDSSELLLSAANYLNKNEDKAA